jgi:hypothetical protein
MKYKKPTYDEYCKASGFARIRYRYGVYVQIIATILLLFLIVYTFTNIEEMKANPAEYAEKQLGVICDPPFTYEITTEYYGSIGNISNT